MKLFGSVRAVERVIVQSNKDGIEEKRVFKLDVRPASKAAAYYGYGNMNFILHGRELTDSGLDVGTKVALYLIPDGEKAPDFSALDDVRRELYETEQARADIQTKYDNMKSQHERQNRERFGAGEQLRALQNENVRLTTELLTLKQATGNFAPAPAMISANQEPAA